MKIHVLSDVHLEFALLKPPVTSADVVILAGDIGVGIEGIQWAKDSFDVPVIYVPGNHEYYDPMLSISEHKELMLESAMGSNVSLLDNDVVVIDGVRFVGSTMWADLKRAPSALYRCIDNIVVDYKTSGVHFSTDYAQSLFDNNKSWLKSELIKPFDGQTVVVTHHAPSSNSLHPQYFGNPWNPCFLSDLENLMGENVDLWVHGHTHNNFDYVVKGTRVICNPRGYPHPLGNWENSGFDPQMIVRV